MNFARKPLKIGCWSFEPRSGEVSCGCAARRLEPIVAHVLEVLIENAGEVVPRTDILEAVWPRRIVVDESVTRAISCIRQALGDTQRPHRYVETLPKRGYRLIAPVNAPRSARTRPSLPHSL